MICRKAIADEAFKAQDYVTAIKGYTECISTALSINLPLDTVLFSNRAATYLALSRYVPAYHDSIQASKADPTNWKAYWRQALALKGMTKKKFRTRLAIEALERCLQCDNLPSERRPQVEEMLFQTKAFLRIQDDATPMPDLSNCISS